MRRGDVRPELIDPLAEDPRVMLLHADRLGAAWLPLRSTVACAVAIADCDPLSAFGYMVTAGLRSPIVIGCLSTTTQERAATVSAGAAACLALPLSIADAHAVVTLCQVAPQSERVRAPLYLDPIHHIAYHGSQHVALTRREFALLHTLQERSCPVAASDLQFNVWGEAAPSRHNLEFYIHQLRRKLARAGLPVTIRTVRGYGYAFATSERAGNAPQLAPPTDHCGELRTTTSRASL